MKHAETPPTATLERLFHEPGRLAIMSALCAASDELSFNELKETCQLTDGNLNRHLKVLATADAIRIRKSFVRGKPRTTIRLSPGGLARFGEYLDTLEAILRMAKEALPADTESALPLGHAVHA